MRTHPLPISILVIATLFAACGPDDSEPAAAPPALDAGPSSQSSDSSPAGPAFVRLKLPASADMPGTYGSGLAFDKSDGTLWMVTDRFNRTKDWKLQLVRVRLGIDKAEILESIPLTEKGEVLTGADLDPEDVAVAPDGSLWVCEENKPFMLHVSRRGEVLERIEPPAEIQDRADDRGFEGITVSPDGRTVYAILQSGVKSEADKLNTILAAYDVATRTFTMHRYRLDDPKSIEYPEEVRGTASACALAAVGDRELLVLERDNQAGGNARLKRVYRTVIPGAASAVPLAKTLVLDLFTLGYKKEKAEGLAAPDARTLLVANDNDGDPTLATEIWHIRM